ncbi:MAG: STAS domain-containing protein [Ottowia sp.]|nr:STAS domain-containing protein [Ottowia sp.]
MSWLLPIRLTRSDASSLLEQGLVVIAQGERVFDARALQQFDSTALAVMLAWRRASCARGEPLAFIHLPEKLVSLSQAYGVEAILTL